MTSGRVSGANWRLDGKCAQLSVKESDKLFFPKSGGRSINAAKVFCDDCPVSKVCLQYALDTEARGIWAGTNKKEREKIMRLNKKATVRRPLIKTRTLVSISFS